VTQTESEKKTSTGGKKKGVPDGKSLHVEKSTRRKRRWKGVSHQPFPKDGTTQWNGKGVNCGRREEGGTLISPESPQICR